MNNQPWFIKPDAFRPPSSNPFLQKLLFFVSVLIFSGNVFAQSPTWRYVVTLPGGAKIYLNDEIKSLPGGSKTAWQKAVNSDASANVSLNEFDCAEKVRRTRQITLYDPDGSVIETTKNRFEWTRIIPGSTGEILHRRLCQPAVPPRIAEISVGTAFLRALPAADAPITRLAPCGARFEVVPETGTGGWFNLVDATTQEDYWLTADDFTVPESASPTASVASPAAIEGDQPVKRGKSKAKTRRTRRRK